MFLSFGATFQICFFFFMYTLMQVSLFKFFRETIYTLDTFFVILTVYYDEILLIVFFNISLLGVLT
jgi:hypothetical protein